MLNYAEIAVFKALLERVFEEKIARSTINSKNNGLKKSIGAESSSQKPELTITEEIYRNLKGDSCQNTHNLHSPKLKSVFASKLRTFFESRYAEGELTTHFGQESRFNCKITFTNVIFVVYFIKRK